MSLTRLYRPLSWVTYMLPGSPRPSQGSGWHLGGSKWPLGGSGWPLRENIFQHHFSVNMQLGTFLLGLWLIVFEPFLPFLVRDRCGCCACGVAVCGCGGRWHFGWFRARAGHRLLTYRVIYVCKGTVWRQKSSKHVYENFFVIFNLKWVIVQGNEGGGGGGGGDHGWWHRIPEQCLLAYEVHLCMGWEVVEVNVEKTLPAIFCYFWSWMSGCEALWLNCVGWRPLWVMSWDGWI
jgi:hypothetical protein